MQTIEPTTLAYLAGMIDGDGREWDEFPTIPITTEKRSE